MHNGDGRPALRLASAPWMRAPTAPPQPAPLRTGLGLRVIQFLLCDQSRPRVGSLLETFGRSVKSSVVRRSPCHRAPRAQDVLLASLHYGLRPFHLRGHLRDLKLGQQLPGMNAVADIDVDLADIGCWVAESESEASWGAVFIELKQRGLSGVSYIVSDDHKGMVKAIERHFQGAVWQRCQVHFVRNALALCVRRYCA